MSLLAKKAAFRRQCDAIRVMLSEELAGVKMSNDDGVDSLLGSKILTNTAHVANGKGTCKSAVSLDSLHFLLR